MFKENRIIIFNDNPSPNLKVYQNMETSEGHYEAQDKIQDTEQTAETLLKESANNAIETMNNLKSLKELFSSTKEKSKGESGETDSHDWATKRFLKQIEDFLNGSVDGIAFFNDPDSTSKDTPINILDKIIKAEDLSDEQISEYTEKISELTDAAEEYLNSITGKLKENLKQNLDKFSDQKEKLLTHNGIRIKLTNDTLITISFVNPYHEFYLDDTPLNVSNVDEITKIVSISTDGDPTIVYLDIKGAKHTLTLKQTPLATAPEPVAEPVAEPAPEAPAAEATAPAATAATEPVAEPAPSTEENNSPEIGSFNRKTIQTDLQNYKSEGKTKEAAISDIESVIFFTEDLIELPQNMTDLINHLADEVYQTDSPAAPAATASTESVPYTEENNSPEIGSFNRKTIQTDLQNYKSEGKTKEAAISDIESAIFFYGRPHRTTSKYDRFN